MSSLGHVIKAPFAYKRLEVGKKFAFEVNINFRPVRSGYVHGCVENWRRGRMFGFPENIFSQHILPSLGISAQVEVGKEVWVHREYFLLAYIAQFGHFCTRTSGRRPWCGTNPVVYMPDLSHKKVEAGEDIWVHREYFLLAYIAQFGHFCTRSGHMIRRQNTLKKQDNENMRLWVGDAPTTVRGHGDRRRHDEHHGDRDGRQFGRPSYGQAQWALWWPRIMFT
ncbi:hypothetical protein B0H10DRAFT_2184042 [Mycena sp. CBHHK59/15]|nr:hypothetical protein B0H10DRAFT_2184042 [Mycena sp. CBHHK59/15]